MITYAHVFHELWRRRCVGPRRDDEAFRRWVVGRIGRATMRERHDWTRHILTIHDTHTMGPSIVPSEVLNYVRRQHRASCLHRRVCLKRLQWAVLRHLWRPGGSLMRRDAPSDLLIRSTRSRLF